MSGEGSLTNDRKSLSRTLMKLLAVTLFMCIFGLALVSSFVSPETPKVWPDDQQFAKDVSRASTTEHTTTQDTPHTNPTEVVAPHKHSKRPVGVQVGPSNDSSIPEFVATDEWQVILPNQPIPAGLHVEMDLTTGVRRAKLLEPSSETVDASSATVEGSGRESPKVVDEQTAMAIVPDTFMQQSGQEIGDVVEYMESHTDSHLRQNYPDVVQALQHAVSGVVSQSLSDVVDDLEFVADFIDDIDHAVELAQGNALPILYMLIHPDTQATSEIRTTALLCLGRAVNNNPKVQKMGVDHGLVQALVRRLPSLLVETDSATRKEATRTVYVLGALVRNSREAQELMNHLEAWTVIENIVRDFATHEDPSYGYQGLVKKCLALVFDVGAEVGASTMSKNLGIDSSRGSFCAALTEVIRTSSDVDILEGAIHSLLSLEPTCDQYITIDSTLQSLKTSFPSLTLSPHLTAAALKPQIQFDDAALSAQYLYSRLSEAAGV